MIAISKDPDRGNVHYWPPEIQSPAAFRGPRRFSLTNAPDGESLFLNMHFLRLGAPTTIVIGIVEPSARAAAMQWVAEVERYLKHTNRYLADEVNPA